MDSAAGSGATGNFIVLYDHVCRLQVQQHQNYQLEQQLEQQYQQQQQQQQQYQQQYQLQLEQQCQQNGQGSPAGVAEIQLQIEDQQLLQNCQGSPGGGAGVAVHEDEVLEDLDDFSLDLDIDLEQEVDGDDETLLGLDAQVYM